MLLTGCAFIVNGVVHIHTFGDRQRFDGVMSSARALFQPMTLMIMLTMRACRVQKRSRQ